jgi:flagellar biosynthesis GTPase FlhF
MQTTTTNSSDTKLSAIDRALAAAKARKAAAGTSAEASTPKVPASKPKAAKEPKAAKVAADKPTDEARAANKAKLAAERAARKAEKTAAEAAAKAERKALREAKRSEKAAAKAAAAAEKKPSHMKKVEKARAKCPALSEAATLTFNEVTANFSAEQIDAIAQHLLVHNRAMATLRATSLDPIPLGATVRITGGDRKFIGLTGKVVASQKLRAKVKVPGTEKLVYIYNGEAEVVATRAAATA